MRRLIALSRVARLACMVMGVAASPVIAQPSGGLAPIPGCNINVERHLARGSLEYIDAETELARQFYRILPPGGFGGLSCLDRLLGSGINIIFAPPDIGSIISIIESRICAIAYQQVSRAMEPLYRNIQSGVDLDRMLPGIGLGRITSGISVVPYQGRGGGLPMINIINTNPVPTVPVRPSNGIFSR
jgi:hypothetical protein